GRVTVRPNRPPTGTLAVLTGQGPLTPGRTRGRSSMAEPQPSKLVMRVRFPSPAPMYAQVRHMIHTPSPEPARSESITRTCGHPSKLVIREVGVEAPLHGGANGRILARDASAVQGHRSPPGR